LAVICGTCVIIVTINRDELTSLKTITPFISTFVIIVTDNISEIDTS
jgi:hypothetical protein